MKCTYCKSRFIKKGQTTTGVQKYKCGGCGKNQREEYINKAWHGSTNDRIKKHVKESCGIRSTARIMEISTGAVISRIKSIAEQIIKPKVKLNKEYEADELKTYVKKKKNEQWVMYSINRKTRQVADFRVGRRNKYQLKGLINTLLLSNAKSDLYRSVENIQDNNSTGNSLPISL